VGNWTVNETSFKIERGNLVREETDAIAVPVGKDLYPDGPSAGAIFAEAPDRLQDELREVDTREPASVSKVASVGFPSDSIYFVAMQEKMAVDAPEEFLEDCWKNLLEAVASDSDIRTLSSMPLGLGDHDFPIDTVSRTGIRCIRDFSDLGDLDEVNIIVYDAIRYSSVERFGNELLNSE